MPRGKARHGDGSIYRTYRKAADGTRKPTGWMVQYQVPDPDKPTGSRLIRRRAKTREQAEKLLTQLKHEADSKSATLLTNEKTRVADYLDRYVKEVLPVSNLAESTRRAYAEIAQSPIKPTLGDVTMRDFPNDARRWLKRLHEAKNYRGRPLSGSTRHKCFCLLSRVLDQAVREEHIARNPLKDLPRPRVDKPEVSVTSGEDFETNIRPHLPDRWIRPLVVLMAHTGCRPGEARGLRWEDVDLDALEVTIRRSDPTTTKTKTGRIRTLPIGDDTARELKRWRKMQNQQRLVMGEGWQDTKGHVFTTPTGTTIDQLLATRRYSEVLRRLKRPTSRPLYALRHGFAADWLKDGGNMHELSALLGHSSIVLTVNTYGHLAPMDYAGRARDRIAQRVSK